MPTLDTKYLIICWFKHFLLCIGMSLATLWFSIVPPQLFLSQTDMLSFKPGNFWDWFMFGLSMGRSTIVKKVENA